MSEGEFRLLWLLRDNLETNSPRETLSQKDMAAQLGFSTAQISAVVEQLRGQGLIVVVPTPGDRRRQGWQLSSSGASLVEALAQLVGSQCHAAEQFDFHEPPVSPRLPEVA